MNDDLLTVRQMRVVHHPPRARWRRQPQPVVVCDGINLDLAPAQVLGVIGEAGCGKSTLARALCGLQPLTGGAVMLDGEIMDKAAWQRRRQDVRMVAQNGVAQMDLAATPFELTSNILRRLNPAADPAALERRAGWTLTRMGLEEPDQQRRADELDTLQRQRVVIAGALAPAPKLLVCDEFDTSLSTADRELLLELLVLLQAEYGFAMIILSRHLLEIARCCQHLMVMYLGRRMEQAPADVLLTTPAHPYTRELLLAEDRDQVDAAPADVASLRNPPGGCVFRVRCPLAQAVCAQRMPSTHNVGPDHGAACLFAVPSSFAVG